MCICVCVFSHHVIKQVFKTGNHQPSLAIHHSVSICQHLWTCIAVFQRYQQLKHFLIEYHYYKRSPCVCMSWFVFQVQMILLSSQGCGAFFSHKIILMVFGTFKKKKNRI